MVFVGWYAIIPFIAVAYLSVVAMAIKSDLGRTAIDIVVHGMCIHNVHD